MPSWPSSTKAGASSGQGIDSLLSSNAFYIDLSSDFQLSFFLTSGTEDCVRVYSEAATREEADTLNKEVSDLVVQLCG